MATAAPTEGLPIFYNSVEPINLDQHGKMKVRGMTSIPQMGQAHAVPVTVDEFTLVQRHLPIVFSVGGTPVPIALMGLNEGVNVFLDGTAGRSIRASISRPICAVTRSFSPGCALTPTSCRCASTRHRER